LKTLRIVIVVASTVDSL